MNPQVAEMDVILSKKILASIKLFLQAVKLCVTPINCTVSADIHNAMYPCCRLWVQYSLFCHYLIRPQFQFLFGLGSFSNFFAAWHWSVPCIYQATPWPGTFTFPSSISGLATQQKKLSFQSASV